MIKRRDVITIKIPFPDISAALAVRSHMYVCMIEGKNKELLKCQTSKPMHLLKNKPPFRYVEEKPDLVRNPFQSKTIIDCDKSFGIDNVSISTDLLTGSRRNICEDLFSSINTKINHDKFVKIHLNPSDLLSLNRKMSIAN